MNKLFWLVLATTSLFSQQSVAQDLEIPEIKRTDLGNGIYMLEGAGGNVGVSVGEDGVFIIDDQYGYMSESILENLAEISDQPLEYVFNTHWHGDHTGGNEHMHAAGGTIVAHDNVRARLASGSKTGRVVLPAPEGALPTITFNEEMSFHLNGNHIRVMHVPSAHTDGDSLVYFPDLNIIHTGDTMLLNRYPFIDLNSGGSALGYIANLENMLGFVDENTKVIPGHGALSGKAEIQALYDMLVEIRDAVSVSIEEGKTDEDILASLTFPQWEHMEWRLGSANATISRLLEEMR